MLNIADQTTEYLLDNLGQSTSDFTVEEIRAELIFRKINEDDDPDNLGFRGGTRPTHQPINP